MRFSYGVQPGDFEVMNINQSGRVGIGTPDPAVKLHVVGDFIATGSKSAVVETASFGKRRLYAVESPQNWFEDFGRAELNEGTANVHIDDVFAETVNTSAGYHVFVTPTGDCSLYVKEKNDRSFTVTSRDGKPDCEFDYRIVAKRMGHEEIRMAKVPDGIETAANLK
jgi:hypothetical protein